MAEERKPREQDSRESETRPSDSWMPASQLPMPNPRKGWEFRYIRTASLGNADTKNVSMRFREGWEPIVAKDYPELQITNDIDSRWPEGVEIGGLLLCKIPTEVVEARAKYHENKANQQLQSVEQGFLNDQDPRMPKHHDAKSRTQFRKG